MREAFITGREARMSEDAGQKWYSVREVCETLGIRSEKSVRGWLKSGELDGWMVGGRHGWRISQHALDVFIARKRWRRPTRRFPAVTQRARPLDRQNE